MKKWNQKKHMRRVKCIFEFLGLNAIQSYAYFIGFNQLRFMGRGLGDVPHPWKTEGTSPLEN